MEWWFIGLGLIVFLILLETERQAGSVRREVSRVHRKLNVILEQLNIPYDEFAGLSDRVKELARDPSGKIAAIKAYREETGAELADAKENVESFIRSLQC